jgi:sirohydrochlorin ferrochelatase
MRNLTSSVKGGPRSGHPIVIFEAFLREALLIEKITKAEENLMC